jgi:hypothetical protein
MSRALPQGYPPFHKVLSKSSFATAAILAVFAFAVRNGAGDVTVTRAFDPTAEETLFFPRLVGG